MVDNRDALIHDYFILLKSKYGYIDIDNVKPPKNIVEQQPSIIERFISKFREPIQIGRFHELKKIRDNIHETRIKRTIKELPRENLEDILYNIATDNKDESLKGIANYYDDNVAAITIILADLTDVQIGNMVKELIELDDSSEDKYPLTNFSR
jgi:hypothetical protein